MRRLLPEHRRRAVPQTSDLDVVQDAASVGLLIGDRFRHFKTFARPTLERPIGGKPFLIRSRRFQFPQVIGQFHGRAENLLLMLRGIIGVVAVFAQHVVPIGVQLPLAARLP